MLHCIASNPATVHLQDSHVARHFIRENDIEASDDEHSEGFVRLLICRDCHSELSQYKDKQLNWHPIFPIHMGPVERGDQIIEPQRLPARPYDGPELCKRGPKRVLYWKPFQQESPLQKVFRTGPAQYNDSVSLAVDIFRQRLSMRQVLLHSIEDSDQETSEWMDVT